MPIIHQVASYLNYVHSCEKCPLMIMFNHFILGFNPHDYFSAVQLLNCILFNVDPNNSDIAMEKPFIRVCAPSLLELD